MLKEKLGKGDKEKEWEKKEKAKRNLVSLVKVSFLKKSLGGEKEKK